VINPFDDENGYFRVLINNEGQHSLWPSFADIPAGWKAVHGPDSRQSCADYVSEHWTDMRPASLAAAMSDASATRPDSS
jgi:uncharacterized protein YbdZ (MbtH family)